MKIIEKEWVNVSLPFRSEPIEIRDIEGVAIDIEPINDNTYINVKISVQNIKDGKYPCVFAETMQAARDYKHFHRFSPWKFFIIDVTSDSDSDTKTHIENKINVSVSMEAIDQNENI